MYIKTRPSVVKPRLACKCDQHSSKHLFITKLLRLLARVKSTLASTQHGKRVVRYASSCACDTGNILENVSECCGDYRQLSTPTSFMKNRIINIRFTIGLICFENEIVFLVKSALMTNLRLLCITIFPYKLFQSTD